MANRARLGGSPLGLIGLKSSPDVNGNSTFNGGNSRNVNVSNYNKSRAGTLFTGKRTLRAWPNIKKRAGTIKNDEGIEVPSEETYDTQGLGDVSYPILNDPKATKDGQVVPREAKAGIDEYVKRGGVRENLHNNTVYDTSVLNIIEQLASTKASLKPADFAYLKNVGVFPNNRLIIARRFPNGVANDLTEVKASPMATLISWVPDNEEFLSVAYNEEWAEAEASFEDVLNDIGNDILLGDNKGGKAGVLNTALANNQYNSEGYSVYPNPVNEEVTFSFPSNAIPREISIFNNLGQMVINKSNLNQIQNISLQSLESGIYFYKIAAANENFTGKLIKK